jgi:hypothetical protein
MIKNAGVGETRGDEEKRRDQMRMAEMITRTVTKKGSSTVKIGSTPKQKEQAKDDKSKKKAKGPVQKSQCKVSHSCVLNLKYRLNQREF